MDPTVLDAVPAEMADVLWRLALDLAVIAVAVVAILTTMKQIVVIIAPGVLGSKVGQVFLEFSPLALGASLALLPGLMDGFPDGLSVVFGLIGGYASPSIYRQIAKRFPALMVSKQGRGEQGSATGTGDQPWA